MVSTSFKADEVASNEKCQSTVLALTLTEKQGGIWFC
jgi:hypothetical protein